LTILCRDSGVADALSTALFNMPLKQGMALIESLPDTEAFWVLPDGTQEYSPGFKRHIRQ
jgi:thiamine biosynthesis lipoprotein